jgi:archaellum component FlaG (FlaF/FlaG flagellin family)
MALSGAILGLISMALATWGLVITVSAVGDAATQLDQIMASATASPEAADPGPTRTKAPRPITLGAVAKEPPFALKVLSAVRAQTVSSSIDTHKAQGSYVVVRVLVKNTGNSPAAFDGTDSAVLDSDGKQYNVDSSATISQNLETGQGLYDEINPGQKATRVLVIDLPKKATPVVIAMSGAEGSEGVLMYLVKDSELASPA